MNINKLLEFTFWADRQYLDWVSTIDPEKYEEELSGFGKSMKDLVYHLDEVYWYWYHYLTDQDYSNEPKSDRSREEMIKSIIKHHKILLKLAQNEDNFKNVTLQWSESDKPVKSSTENILLNFMSHSAYHRGQLAVLLRYYGFDQIKDTDFNPYLYQMGQK